MSRILHLSIFIPFLSLACLFRLDFQYNISASSWQLWLFLLRFFFIKLNAFFVSLSAFSSAFLIFFNATVLTHSSRAIAAAFLSSTIFLLAAIEDLDVKMYSWFLFGLVSSSSESFECSWTISSNEGVWMMPSFEWSWMLSSSESSFVDSSKEI